MASSLKKKNVSKLKYKVNLTYNSTTFEVEAMNKTTTAFHQNYSHLFQALTGNC